MPNYRKIIPITIFASTLIIGAGIFSSAAMAQTIKSTHKTFTRPAAIGTVVAISGNTITLNGKNSITYTIDATGAIVTKVIPGTIGVKPTSTAITVSQIQVGDNLVAQGTASGTSFTTTKITDGLLMPKRGFMARSGFHPATIGTVASVNNNTISLTGRNKTVYTVDATNAIINKITPGASGAKPTSTVIAVSQVQIGDSLMVQGTVSGTSVAATKITDGRGFTGKGGVRPAGHKPMAKEVTVK